MEGMLGRYLGKNITQLKNDFIYLKSTKPIKKLNEKKLNIIMTREEPVMSSVIMTINFDKHGLRYIP